MRTDQPRINLDRLTEWLEYERDQHFPAGWDIDDVLLSICGTTVANVDINDYAMISQAMGESKYDFRALFDESIPLVKDEDDLEDRNPEDYGYLSVECDGSKNSLLRGLALALVGVDEVDEISFNATERELTVLYKRRV